MRQLNDSPRDSPEALHLSPREVWERHGAGQDYYPDDFADDGFIHCTHGADELMRVANHYYRDDPRPFVVCTIQLDRVRAPVRYDDQSRIYPHIYGPLNRDAVTDVRPVRRSADGTFEQIA